MNPFLCNRRMLARTRREFLELSSLGFGSLALSCLLQRDSLALKAANSPAKAKHVIFVFLQGGPSQVDTFDPKPALNRLHGQFLPPSFLEGESALAQIKANESKLMGSRRIFKKHGQSGLEISDLFENLAKLS